jgi:hypothetical protein
MKNHGECSSIVYLSASSKYFLDGTSTLRYGFELNDFPNLITSGVSENCLIILGETKLTASIYVSTDSVYSYYCNN